ncbi:MAG TPA: SMP-30/gluconolactonase/LRE family protein [Solirubrobacteraceae bacterium]|nr:SMP-30/gluconolactonase/LRE family protein [Solirubrobacteraceae bacterium]
MELVTDQVRHAESPRWADGRLWFSDTHDQAVKALDADGEVERIAETAPRPSGLGRHPDGRWLLVTSRDDKLNWLQDGHLTEACDLAPHTLGHAGDMVVDGHGHAYISDTGFDHGAGEEPRLGQVLLFTERDGVRVVATDTNWANGCAVSPDGERFFLAETFGERITVFTVRDDGSLASRRTFAELGTAPDGLCLDADGGVWVALPFRREFAHLDADGRIDRRVPARGALACAVALGGEDGRTLYGCSVNATAQNLSRGILEGGVIESTVVDTPGAGWP